MKFMNVVKLLKFKKAIVIASCVSASSAFGAEYVCDVKKELGSRSLIKIEHNSEKFKQVYTGIRQEYENSIAKICEFNKKCKFSPDGLGEKEIREAYAQTSWGKKESTDLKKLKDDFQYTAVDNYLFDQNKFNYLGPVTLTHTARKEDRVYYINEDKVVGYLDQVGDEGVFYRYDSKCNVSEIVSFAKLTEPADAIRLKVTKKYCTNSQNKGATFKHSEKDIRGWGAHFQNHEGVEDQMEAEELCSQWIAKPEPHGLVVEAPSVDEIEEKSKTKKGKKSKKKAKEKSLKKKKKKESAGTKSGTTGSESAGIDSESAGNKTDPTGSASAETRNKSAETESISAGSPKEFVGKNPFEQSAVALEAEPAAAKPEKTREPVSVIDSDPGAEAEELEEVQERQPKPSKKKKSKKVEPEREQEPAVEAFGE